MIHLPLNMSARSMRPASWHTLVRRGGGRDGCHNLCESGVVASFSGTGRSLARFVPLDSENHALLSDEPAWAKFVGELEAFLAEDASHHRRFALPACGTESIVVTLQATSGEASRPDHGRVRAGRHKWARDHPSVTVRLADFLIDELHREPLQFLSDVLGQQAS